MAASDGTGNRDSQKRASELSDAAGAGVTGKGSSQGVLKANTDVAQARSAAGEEFGHTIVTGLKIKIDPTTGKLSFQDDSAAPVASETPKAETPPTASAAGPSLAETPLDAPPASVSDLPPVPVVEPGESANVEQPIAAEQPASPEGASASVEAATNEAAKPEAAASGNRRLSAETLFAFALPEAVLNAADEAMKLKTQADIPAPKLDGKSSSKDGTTVKQSAPGVIPNRRTKAPLIFVLAAVALSGLLWVLFGDQLQKSSDSTSSPVGKFDPAESEVSTQTAPGDGAVEDESDKSSDSDVVVDKPSSAKGGAIENQPVAEPELTEAQAAAVVLLQSKDPRVVEAGVQSGIKLKDDLVTRRILSLVSDPNVFVRVAIAKAVVSNESYSVELKSEVVATLLQLLEDKDYLVRGYSARALGATGERTALPKLKTRLDIETEEVVKKLIRSSIDQIEKQ